MTPNRFLRARGSLLSRVLLLLVSPLVCPGLAAAQVFTLGVRIDNTMPVGPYAMTTGDFNRDGLLDLAVTTPENGTVSIRFGDGTGGLSPGTGYPTGSDARSITSADLNGDGWLDLIVANLASDNVSVLLGKPLGQFGVKTDFPAGNEPYVVDAGDLNGDSKLDLVVANAFSGDVSVLLGTGTGSFGAKVDHPASPEPSGMALVDVNADGHLDVVTSDFSGGFHVLAGNGDGTLGGAISHGGGLGFVYAMAVGDVTGDGAVDVVLHAATKVLVHVGNGSGGFGAAIPHDLQDVSTHLAIGDMNNDGAADLVFANVTYLRASAGNGSGTFAWSAEAPLGTGTVRSIELADLNRDGRLDVLVAADGSPDQIMVFLASDLTLRGPTAYATASMPGAVALADLNADGKLDALASCSGAPAVSVRLGAGDGTLGAGTDFTTGTSPAGLAVGDVSGDGKPDLVVANRGANTVSVLLGNGSGSFAAKTDYATAAEPVAVSIGNVLGDANLDLVVATAGSNFVSVVPGSGLGAFGIRTDVNVFSPQTDLTLADMNLDGRLDLVITTTTGSLEVGLGAPGGGFDKSQAPLLGHFHQSIEVADLDGDGFPDFVAGGRADSMVTVLRGNGSGGGINPVTFHPTNAGAGAVALGDVNGDGRLDIAVANRTTPSVSVLLGNGLAKFGPDVEYSIGAEAKGVALGDLDGDGRADLAATSQTANELSIRLGRFRTATSLSASPNPVEHGASLTLRADVSASGPGAGMPNGLVRFYDGTSAIGSAGLVAGAAELTFTASEPWERTYRAVYLGTPTYGGSRSAPLELMVYVTNPVGVGEPLASGLALAPMRPNPGVAGRPLLVRFALPSGGAARLSLVDVRGRVIAAEDVGAFGPGEHAVDLGTRARLSPGLYFVRLVHGGQARSTRLVVVD